MQLWLRLGDAGDYEAWDDIEQVAGILQECSVTDLTTVAGGIEACGFEGDNYISLYWGDAEAELIRELTEAEFAELVDLVSDF